jgi:hypothetical protein
MKIFLLGALLTVLLLMAGFLLRHSTLGETRTSPVTSSDGPLRRTRRLVTHDGNWSLSPAVTKARPLFVRGPTKTALVTTTVIGEKAWRAFSTSSLPP